MTPLRARALLVFAAASGSVSLSAAVAAPVDETQRTEAALRAIVEHWGAAEQQGDLAYLEQLLVPEYRSVDAKGTAHVRALLLEHARAKAATADARQAVEAFKQAHPTAVAVTIHGTLGIVSYFHPQRGVDHSVRGSDIFVYEANRWHAVYSLHNAVD